MKADTWLSTLPFIWRHKHICYMTAHLNTKTQHYNVWPQHPSLFMAFFAISILPCYCTQVACCVMAANILPLCEALLWQFGYIWFCIAVLELQMLWDFDLYEIAKHRYVLNWLYFRFIGIFLWHYLVVESKLFFVTRLHAFCSTYKAFLKSFIKSTFYLVMAYSDGNQSYKFLQFRHANNIDDVT